MQGDANDNDPLTSHGIATTYSTIGKRVPSASDITLLRAEARFQRILQNGF